MPPRDNRLRAPDTGALNVVGPRVRERRRTLGLKQHSLAARIAAVTGYRWTPSTLDVTRIETGIRTCADTEVLAIAAALACDPGRLFAGDLNGMDTTASDGQTVVAPWPERKD
jgi:hypothetical protein